MAVDFSTSDMRSIYPQPKTYSPVSRSSEAGTGQAIAATADLLNTGVNVYLQGKERALTNEAYQQATDLTNEYLSGSPTEIQYLQGQKEKLSANLSNATESNRSTFQQQLDDVNNRLIRAKAQGGMTPFEFSRRVAKINQDLAQQNPGFTREITQKMQEVYQISGISDVLQKDTAYYATLNKQQAKMAEDRQNLLIKYHGYEALSYPETLQEKLINEASALQANTERYTALTANSKALTDYDRQKIDEEIRASGGYGQYQSTVVNSVFNQIQDVLQTQPDPNLQRQQIKMVINKARIDMSSVVTSSVGDPAVTAFKENMNTIFKDLSEYADKEVNLENILTWKTNYNNIKQQDYEVANGINEVNGFLKFAQVYGEVKKNYGVDSSLLAPAEQMLTQLGNRVLDRISPDSASIIDTKIKGTTLFDASMKELDSQVDKLNKNGDIKSLALYGNTRTNHLKYITSLPESPEKQKRIDNTLKSLAIPSQEVFDSAYNIPEFRTEITDMLNSNNKYSLLRIEKLRQLRPDEDLNIYFDEDRGQVRSDNVLLDYELRSVNNYITIRGRIANKDPKTIAKDILKNNFGSLDIFGVGPGNGATIEE